MTNIEAIREYRASRDAAEGVALANGLREVLSTNLCGNAEAWRYLDEVAERAGFDPNVHVRRATRQRDAIMARNDGLVWRKVCQLLRVKRSAYDTNPNFEEALQEGRIGLMRAIEEFDESRGSSFSTCAMLWIQHHVQTCMHRQVDFAKQRSARMPPEVVKAVVKFRTLHGREPEPHEVECKGRPVTPEQWARWTNATFVVSVEDMVSRVDDEGKHRGSDEMLADESDGPDSVLVGAHLREAFSSEMAAMSPRNREILRAIFIDGRAIVDVAAEYRVAPSRIHEIKSTLEKRLRKVLAA